MDSYEIRLCGTGGQGLILAGRILADAVVREGRWVAQSQAFEPLSRGGVSQADLVISSSMVDFPLVSDLDFLLVRFKDRPVKRSGEPFPNGGAVVALSLVFRVFCIVRICMRAKGIFINL